MGIFLYESPAGQKKSSTDAERLSLKSQTLTDRMLGKCSSMSSDFDPIFQVMLVQVAGKIKEGTIFDKHMLFLAASIAVIVLEELI